MPPSLLPPNNTSITWPTFKYYEERVGVRVMVCVRGIEEECSTEVVGRQRKPGRGQRKAKHLNSTSEINNAVFRVNNSDLVWGYKSCGDPLQLITKRDL